jgi:hypothetical protein
MPSPEEPDGDENFRLNKGELDQLVDLMVDKYTTLEGSLEFLAQMRFPRERIPIFRTAVQFWRDVLAEVNRSSDSATLYRRFRAVAVRRTDADRGIVTLINAADPQAREVVDPRPNGCHAIVWTESERERQTVMLWLVDSGLSPWQVWANTEMTSYAVSEPNAELLASRIRRLRPDLLFKVIEPGEEDYLVDRVTVIGQDGREFPMRAVPVQLTISDLADSAVHLYPSADSVLAGAVSDAVYKGVRIDPASTLLQNKFRDRASISIGSVRFGKIKVLCIGASPDSMPRVHFDEEVRKIKDKANLGRIELVDELSHAKIDDLFGITAYRPDVIHLSCHGEGLNLIIEDGDGAPFPMSAASFAELLAQWQYDYSHELSAIVLNSCSGEHIGPILVEAARKVIAHRGKLSGPRAERFTEKLYHELSRIPSLDTAARFAARAVYTDVEGLLILPPPPLGSR